MYEWWFGIFDQYLLLLSSTILLNSSSDDGSTEEYWAPIYLAISSKLLPAAYRVKESLELDCVFFASYCAVNGRRFQTFILLTERVPLHPHCCQFQYAWIKLDIIEKLLQEVEFHKVIQMKFILSSWQFIWVLKKLRTEHIFRKAHPIGGAGISQ